VIGLVFNNPEDPGPAAGMHRSYESYQSGVRRRDQAGWQAGVAGPGMTGRGTKVVVLVVLGCLVGNEEVQYNGWMVRCGGCMGV